MMISEINHQIWNSDDVCEKCRKERSRFTFKRRNTEVRCIDYEKDKWLKKGVKDFCPVYPGFFNRGNEVEGRAIFFVLESMSGTREWEEKKKTNVSKVVEDLRSFYLEDKKLMTFHQHCIRKILREFDNYPYVVTDAVKCFVKKEPRKNFLKAGDSCSVFLGWQIYGIKPKVVVLFGNDARDAIADFVEEKYWDEIKKLKHGESTSVKLKEKNQKISTTIVFSRFPTAWQADNWIKDGSDSPVISKIKTVITQQGRILGTAQATRRGGETPQSAHGEIR